MNDGKRAEVFFKTSLGDVHAMNGGHITLDGRPIDETDVVCLVNALNTARFVAALPPDNVRVEPDGGSE